MSVNATCNPFPKKVIPLCTLNSVGEYITCFEHSTCTLHRCPRSYLAMHFINFCDVLLVWMEEKGKLCHINAVTKQGTAITALLLADLLLKIEL